MSEYLTRIVTRDGKPIIVSGDDTGVKCEPEPKKGFCKLMVGKAAGLVYVPQCTAFPKQQPPCLVESQLEALGISSKEALRVQ